MLSSNYRFREIRRACTALSVVLLGTIASGQQAPAPSVPPAATGDIVTLNAFEVSTSQDYGYRKQNSVTTSRIGANIMTIPQSVEIISSELMNDLAISDANQVFRYSSSVTAGEGEAAQTGIFTMRGFELPRYINGVGLATSFAIAPFLPSDNLDRVELAKGPVGLFYGNSTPNGVANYVTKRPEFIEASSLEVSAGSYKFSKAVIDSQGVINRDLGLAYRLIASTQQSEARVQFQEKDYTFVAPSVVLKPNKILEVSAEVDYEKSHNPYYSDSSDWNLAVNPKFYQDLSNPSPQLIAYAEKSLGATDPASAQAVLRSRWSVAGPLSTDLITWSGDTLAAGGAQPFLYTGNHIAWNQISPAGDKFAAASPQSNLNQTATTADVGVTITPADFISFKYRWLHQDVRGNFDREVYGLNFGILPSGRYDTLNATTSTIASRDAVSDTQQGDIYLEKTFLGMKNELILGAEDRRGLAVAQSAPIDFTKAPSRVDKNGNPETGIQVFQYYDPFTQTSPSLYTVQAGAVSSGVPTIAVGKDEESYFSYRASAFGDKLNTLVGIRHIHDIPTNRSDNTYTAGAIYQALPGLSMFASTSSTFLITNTFNVVSLGSNSLLPGEQHLLNNETGKGSEAGLKSSWHDNLISGTVSYYEDERDNVVTPSYEQTLTDPRNLDSNPNNDVRWYENGGLQRVRGVDADLIFTPSTSLQILLNFEREFEAKVINDPSVNPTTLNSTYIKEFLRPLMKSPAYKGNLVVKYTFNRGTFKNLSLGTAVRYSDTYSVTNNTTVDIWVPTETLVDVFAAYRTKVFKQMTELQLNVLNILNQVNDITRGNGAEVRVTAKFKF